MAISPGLKVETAEWRRRRAAGRGAVFGAGPTGGGGAPVSIVYVMDVSRRMQEGDKIGKAKEALKKALSELKAVDLL